MKKFLISFIVVVAIGLGGLLVARFFFGGGKTLPQNFVEVTNEVKDDWKQQTFDEAGLSFKIPPDTTFRKEIADDQGRIRTATFISNINDYILSSAVFGVSVNISKMNS